MNWSEQCPTLREEGKQNQAETRGQRDRQIDIETEKKAGIGGFALLDCVPRNCFAVLLINSSFFIFVDVNTHTFHATHFSNTRQFIPPRDARPSGYTLLIHSKYIV